MDEQARIIASTREKAQTFAPKTLNNAPRELKPYGRSEVVSQILSKRSGFVEQVVGGKSQVLAYYPIYSLGWYYLVEADTELLATPF